MDVRVCGCEGGCTSVRTHSISTCTTTRLQLFCTNHLHGKKEENEGPEKKGRGIEGGERREEKRKEGGQKGEMERGEKEQKGEKKGMEKWRRSLKEVRLNPTYMY